MTQIAMATSGHRMTGSRVKSGMSSEATTYEASETLYIMDEEANAE